MNFSNDSKIPKLGWSHENDQGEAKGEREDHRLHCKVEGLTFISPQKFTQQKLFVHMP